MSGAVSCFLSFSLVVDGRYYCRTNKVHRDRVEAPSAQPNKPLFIKHAFYRPSDAENRNDETIQQDKYQGTPLKENETTNG